LFALLLIYRILILQLRFVCFAVDLSPVGEASSRNEISQEDAAPARAKARSVVVA
jgi:hypothetical protein